MISHSKCTHQQVGCWWSFPQYYTHDKDTFHLFTLYGIFRYHIRLQFCISVQQIVSIISLKTLCDTHCLFLPQQGRLDNYIGRTSRLSLRNQQFAKSLRGVINSGVTWFAKTSSQKANNTGWPFPMVKTFVRKSQRWWIRYGVGSR